MTGGYLSPVKRLVPTPVKNRLKTSSLFVRHRSSSVNVYHCSVYRTGSQWIRSIMSDRRVIRYSGLLHLFEARRVFGTPERPDRTIRAKFPFTEPFPAGRIVTLYASYHNYQRIPKPRSYRSFFVFRDPRDIIVSHYFSRLRSAQVMRPERSDLKLPDAEEGIALAIDELDRMGMFSSLASWTTVPQNDRHVRLVRFEDLIGPEASEAFRSIMDHCDIAIPESSLRQLLQDHSFRSLSGGREPGLEDTSSHYRKGIAGDWRNHLTENHLERLQAVSGDLVALCGYEA